jgi:hypothetical protein
MDSDNMCYNAPEIVSVILALSMDFVLAVSMEKWNCWRYLPLNTDLDTDYFRGLEV